MSEAIFARLLKLHPKIIDLGLGRVKSLLDRLGNPQRNLPPVVHVAGTNGKGSTVAYLRAILEAAGLSVHCYTSPHLVDFRERIRLGGELISEPELAEIIGICETANNGEPITVFEITTAAAFLAFSRQPADYLLLEVGLGGRLDATNVIENPLVSVITAIDYDHQDYLGDTLTEIAREKAGIIKRHVPVVVAVQPDEALEEIERVATKLSAPLHVANRDWQSFEQHGRMVFQDERGLIDLPAPILPGRHQFDNAGNAVAALRVIGDSRVLERHVEAGLRSVEWPARMQRLNPGTLCQQTPPDIELWLDGGHNPAAARVLAQAFSELNDRHSRPLVLVWGMLDTKDAAGFISAFAGMANRVIAVTIEGEAHAIPADSLAYTARQNGLNSSTADNLRSAFAEACQIKPAPRILICGSLYLAGKVLTAQGSK